MHMAKIGVLAVVAVALVAFSCSRAPKPEPRVASPDIVKVRWDDTPGSARWTNAALKALDAHGAPLVSLVPADISKYCPAYPDLGAKKRKAFWVNLLASLSFHESTWRPEASGGDGRWHGLLQISPATARGYGCNATSADALKSGASNLSCAIRIMAETVPRDGVISQGMRGIAADWGPFHQARKRSDIQTYTSDLPYCQS